MKLLQSLFDLSMPFARPSFEELFARTWFRYSVSGRCFQHEVIRKVDVKRRYGGGGESANNWSERDETDIKG